MGNICIAKTTSASSPKEIKQSHGFKDFTKNEKESSENSQLQNQKLNMQKQSENLSQELDLKKSMEVQIKHIKLQNLDDKEENHPKAEELQSNFDEYKVLPKSESKVPNNFTQKKIHLEDVPQLQLSNSKVPEEPQSPIKEIYHQISVSVRDLLAVKLQTLTNNKQVIYNKLISSLTEQDKNVEMTFSRCILGAPLPKINFSLDPLVISVEQNTYTYPKQERDNEMVWHVNFADAHLFGFYSQDLFAQDEIQCAEHPLLCHLKEYVGNHQQKKFAALTIEKNQETPILITNAQRLGKVDIDANPSKNKNSLYGQYFYYASAEDVERRTEVITKEKVFTNMISMTALSILRGEYTLEQITFTFNTAFKSFSSAVHLSQGKSVIIHTGNWGCGAFGNNMQLIALIQLLAAKAAGVSKIVYHTFNLEGTQEFSKGKENYDYIINQIAIKLNNENSNQKYIEYALNFCLSLKLKWKSGDGN